MPCFVDTQTSSTFFYALQAAAASSAGTSHAIRWLQGPSAATCCRALGQPATRGLGRQCLMHHSPILVRRPFLLHGPCNGGFCDSEEIALQGKHVEKPAKRSPAAAATQSKATQKTLSGGESARCWNLHASNKGWSQYHCSSSHMAGTASALAGTASKRKGATPTRLPVQTLVPDENAAGADTFVHRGLVTRLLSSCVEYPRGWSTSLLALLQLPARR